MKTESFIFILIFSYQRSNIPLPLIFQSSHSSSSGYHYSGIHWTISNGEIGKLLPINCFVNQVSWDHSFAHLKSILRAMLLWCGSCYRPLWPRVSNIYSLDLYRESLPISAFSVLKYEALRQMGCLTMNITEFLSMQATHLF